jgi:KaiC/GvpD/RAD55 family RecA-like ATPase
MANNTAAANGKIELIQGFSELFETAEVGDSAGIRGGATLLISGPPGSGKTTFEVSTQASGGDSVTT